MRPFTGRDLEVRVPVAPRSVRVPPARIMENLTLLERPAGITENGTTRISQIGVYEEPTTPGDPLGLRPGKVCLR